VKIALTLVALFLAAHGVAHFVGFAVPWRLVSAPDLPYKTTILAGKINVGDAGIRAVGVLWLLTGVAFVVAAGAMAFRMPWALPLVAAVTIASGLLSAAEWPQARVGLFINVALLAALPVMGSLSWRHTSANARQALAAHGAASVGLFTAECLSEVPPVVGRYFRRVLREGQPLVASAELVQDAEFFVGNRWRPLHATQRYTTTPPGFVWDARIRTAPLMPVYVRDSYIGGSGAMHGEFLGLYAIVDQAHRRELDAGALLRYFAEAVWFPTALLPGPSVRWQAIDDHSALAKLTDAHTMVSLTFRFNAAGDIVEAFTPDRFAESQGAYERRAWLVRCGEYEQHAAMRIPVHCEVEWQMPQGPLPYWRGRIVEARYDFGAP
jgi:hypothetical protein